jgi:hypothetical protein
LEARYEIGAAWVLAGSYPMEIRAPEGEDGGWLSFYSLRRTPKKAWLF